MPWPWPFGETVQLLDGTVTGEDDDGNDERTWPVKASYEGCAVAPADANGTGGNEYTDGRDLVVIGLTAYLPPGVVLAATDRLRVRGEDWEVVGQPQEWHSPLTDTRPGTPVALRRVTG